MNYRKKIGLCLLAGVTLLACSGFALVQVGQARWKHLLTPAERCKPYAVKERGDSMVHVVMIGDSWAGMHVEGGLDGTMTQLLKDALEKEVTFVSRGRGGAKSKEVYRMMFESACTQNELNQGYCTQALIAVKPDFCIVTAGINDAAANIGPDCYLANYTLILEWLLQNGITPVVVQMPDVNIRRVYDGKPLYDLMADRLRAWMTRCDAYEVDVYSEALEDMLSDRQKYGQVVFVRKDEWNADGYRDSRGLYLEDEIHLNARGYRLLDSCVAARIALSIK